MKGMKFAKEKTAKLWLLGATLWGGAGTLTAIALDTSFFTLPLSFLPQTEAGSSDQLEARQDLQYLPVLHCSPVA